MTARHYDNPLVITYPPLGLTDFGAGATAFAIKVPPRVTMCRIEEIHVNVTETFNEVTTEGFVRIGTAADADAFAELGMGAAADTNGWGRRDQDAAGVETLKDTSDGGLGVIDVSAEGHNISQLEVTTVAPTGGTPAGKGYVSITLAWW